MTKFTTTELQIVQIYYILQREKVNGRGFCSLYQRESQRGQLKLTIEKRE